MARHATSSRARGSRLPTAHRPRTTITFVYEKHDLYTRRISKCNSFLGTTPRKVQQSIYGDRPVSIFVEVPASLESSFSTQSTFPTSDLLFQSYYLVLIFSPAPSHLILSFSWFLVRNLLVFCIQLDGASTYTWCAVLVPLVLKVREQGD
jgi:hypothetical protein